MKPFGLRLEPCSDTAYDTTELGSALCLLPWRCSAANLGNGEMRSAESALRLPCKASGGWYLKSVFLERWIMHGL